MEKYEISIDSVLNNWNSLNSVLAELSIDEIKGLLAYEKKNKNRAVILKRLHQRYTTLKTKKERDELLKDSNN